MTCHKAAAQDPFSWVNSSGRVWRRDVLETLAGLWLAGPHTEGLGVWESVEETGGKLSICVFCRENVSGQPHLGRSSSGTGNRESSLQLAALLWRVGLACRVSYFSWTSTCMVTGHSAD